jgi:hypothetical protein
VGEEGTRGGCKVCVSVWGGRGRGDLKYMLAFTNPAAAVGWGLTLQEEALRVVCVGGLGGGGNAFACDASNQHVQDGCDADVCVSV